MNIHTIFVEPANYTQDLIENVYHKLGISYSFLNSNSLASNDNRIVDSAKHLFDKKSVWKNFVYLWKCSRENDLVIVNGYNHTVFILMWLFSELNSCTIGIESDTPYRSTTGIKSIIKKIYLKFIFSNKKILGLSGGTGLHRDLFLNYGMPANRILFVPMMVDNSKYFKAIKKKNVNNDIPLKFIFVGRLASEKNLQLLIQSFKSVLQQGKIATLNIIGEGVCRSELEKNIGNSNNISLLGKKFGLDLLEFYNGAQVLILPSSFEPWGLVVNEAMAAGLPVICSSAVGSAFDLIQKPNTGWVFEDNNEEELTALLLDIIAHPEQIKEKAKRGQEFMMNHWNYSLYIQCLNKVIDYVEKN